MITENLFDEILLDPVRRGADSLVIASGYVSPSMAYQHFDSLKETAEINVNVIYGMAGKEGVGMGQHLLFRRLADEHYKGRFSCRYMMASPPVHAKIYVWSKGMFPSIAFAGSGNYTNQGFFGYREAFEKVDPKAALEFCNGLLDYSVSCTDPDIENHIKFKSFSVADGVAAYNGPLFTSSSAEIDGVREELPLLARDGHIHQRAGLNWGQRPGRNPNQAYIPVPKAVAGKEFFPPRGIHFTVLTDDGDAFDAVIAQEGDKALETPLDNSWLGRYFRRRLRVPSGEKVEKAHLDAYGRTSVSFSRLEDSLYYLEFSV